VSFRTLNIIIDFELPQKFAHTFNALHFSKHKTFQRDFLAIKLQVGLFNLFITLLKVAFLSHAEIDLYLDIFIRELWWLQWQIA